MFKIQFTTLSGSVKFFATALVVLLATSGYGQSRGVVTGTVKGHDTTYRGLVINLNSKWETLTDEDGYFSFIDVPYGKALLQVEHKGIRRYRKSLVVSSPNTEINITLLDDNANELEDVIIKNQLRLNDLGRLGTVRGNSVFEAKKNDVLVMKNIDANMATNTARQVFAKVASTNVWENDGSGIQLNVSSRGLSPNRSWEYNMRQNGYDIAADILGYPDMYYSPPMEAISHIEVVRGAASLQYGTQMGGLLHFVLKTPGDKPLEGETRQSVGSFGLFNSYNSIGGTKNKWTYFGYFHHRTADGWRENSDYTWNTGYAAVSYQVNNRLKISGEYTRMNFLLHLSAGLTDSMFKVNPRGSVRERNWFKVNWNLPVVKLDYKLSGSSRINITSYMSLSSRNSIENTKPVNVIADTGYRDIRNDHYHNFGTEVRYINEYRFAPKISGALAAGLRYYKGRTQRGQGLGTNGREADFSFLHPGNLEYSDYTFLNTNVAVFAENVFKFGKLSVVPGIRYEYIKFQADGYYNTSGGRKDERGLASKRNFPLLGLGMEYKLTPTISTYGNFTQGFRAANFNDIRITSPNIVVDPNLKDSKGYTLDLGIRGKIHNFVNFDIDGFYLSYDDRIGLVTRKNSNNTSYQISTNIADSRNMGVESFVEVDILKAIDQSAKNNISAFVAYSYIDARYIKSENDVLKNKMVEFVPRNILRMGVTFRNSRVSTTINYSKLSKQYSDANNTVFTASGSNGIVPGYSVLDWSSKVNFKAFKVGFSLNNVTNNKYFTRRATSYPGPGIIPAEPVNFLVSLEIKL